jgi:hypothetical protein
MSNDLDLIEMVVAPMRRGADESAGAGWHVSSTIRLARAAVRTGRADN